MDNKEIRKYLRKPPELPPTITHFTWIPKCIDYKDLDEIGEALVPESQRRLINDPLYLHYVSRARFAYLTIREFPSGSAPRRLRRMHAEALFHIRLMEMGTGTSGGDFEGPRDIAIFRVQPSDTPWERSLN